MTYYGAKELAESFRTVRKNTISVAEDIPEDKYGHQPAPGSMTVAQVLSHIALGTRLPREVHGADRMTTFEGFDFFAYVQKRQAEEATLTTKAQILEVLRADGDAFAAWLETLSEDLLKETVTFPPPITPASKTRFEMLLGTKEHEMHHRAQLMLIERLLGIVPHLTRQREAFREQMTKQATTT